MSGGRRGAALLLTVLAVLGLAGAAPASAAGGSGYAADRVLVVGVAGLAWSDVSAERTPQLWSLAGRSAIGAVSVRAARPTTCVLDGWATLGAGNRARFAGPVPVGSAPSRCGPQEQARLPDPARAVQAIDRDGPTRSFGSQAAALGRAVGCADVVGSAATLAVAAPGVRIRSAAFLPAGDVLTRLLAACPLNVVSLDRRTAGSPAAVDAAVGRLRAAAAALPGRTLLVVAGISEVGDGRPQLHLGIVSGPGFDRPGWLVSSSTGRAPYAELIDVAPTVLRALGTPAPAAMNGEPMTRVGGRPALPRAVAELNRADTAASVHYRSTGDFFWTLVVVDAVLLLAGLEALGGLPRVSVRRAPGPRRAVRIATLPVAALPVATYLASLVPWAASDQPRWTLLGSVVVADLLVAAVAGLGPWRRRPLGPPLAILAITLATLVADVVTGSPLEFDGLLGYDAIVAGRFVGYGNLTFSLVLTSGLLLTAAVATAAGRRSGAHSRRTTALVTLLLGAAVVVLDGAPQLGRDFGGVLSAVPAFLVLALLLIGARVSVVRLGAILGAAVVVVGGVAVLDWLRPADQRTHLGRFVQQVIDGDAWTVVSRKAGANVGILTGSPLALMLPVILVAVVWLARPRGLLRRGGTGLAPRDAAVLRAALIAVGLGQLIGAAVNDSGVALPATAAALLVPLLIGLAAAAPATGTGASLGTGDHSRRDPAEDPGRVTVGSRGSTAWHT